MSKLWKVYGAADYAALAAQSGVPYPVLRGEITCDVEVGEVEAPTKGAAILAAHERFPYVPVADLDVRESVLPPAEERQHG